MWNASIRVFYLKECNDCVSCQEALKDVFARPLLVLLTKSITFSGSCIEVGFLSPTDYNNVVLDGNFRAMMSFYSGSVYLNLRNIRNMVVRDLAIIDESNDSNIMELNNSSILLKSIIFDSEGNSLVLRSEDSNVSIDLTESNSAMCSKEGSVFQLKDSNIECICGLGFLEWNGIEDSLPFGCGCSVRENCLTSSDDSTSSPIVTK